MSYEYESRSDGVPAAFMQRALVPDLISYLKASGVKGGLTRFRNDQLRVGAFFVNAACEAENARIQFPWWNNFGEA